MKDFFAIIIKIVYNLVDKIKGEMAEWSKAAGC